jgi:hypothetical protein
MQSIRGSRTGVVGSLLILPLAQMGLLWPVQLLLEKGSNVDAQSSNGGTALIIAAYYKHYGVVRLLVEKGANTKLKSSSGHTVLGYLHGDCPLDIKPLLERR